MLDYATMFITVYQFNARENGAWVRHTTYRTRESIESRLVAP